MCRSVGFRFLSLSLVLSSLTQQHSSSLTHTFLIRQSPGDWEEIFSEETGAPYCVHRKTRADVDKPEYLAWTHVGHGGKKKRTTVKRRKTKADQRKATRKRKALGFRLPNLRC